MKEKLMRFFYGRNGRDSFSEFTLFVSLFFLVLSLGLQRKAIYPLVYGLALGILLYSMYRIMSKNLAARQRENLKYLGFKNKIKAKLNLQKAKFKNRKEYKYLKCEVCGQNLRVPKKKGKITVTCSKCKNKISTRT